MSEIKNSFLARRWKLLLASLLGVLAMAGGIHLTFAIVQVRMAASRSVDM